MADANNTAVTPGAGPPARIGKEHSNAGTAWTAITVFVIVLLLLAIFILQNSQSVKISFFGFHGHMSLAVGLLLATVAGATLTLLVGSIRIFQLKHINR